MGGKKMLVTFSVDKRGKGKYLGTVEEHWTGKELATFTCYTHEEALACCYGWMQAHDCEYADTDAGMIER